MCSYEYIGEGHHHLRMLRGKLESWIFPRYFLLICPYYLYLIGWQPFICVATQPSSEILKSLVNSHFSRAGWMWMFGLDDQQWDWVVLEIFSNFKDSMKDPWRKSPLCHIPFQFRPHTCGKWKTPRISWMTVHASVLPGALPSWGASQSNSSQKRQLCFIKSHQEDQEKHLWVKWKAQSRAVFKCW